MSVFSRLSWEARVSVAAAAALCSMMVCRWLADSLDPTTRLRLLRVQFLVFVTALMSIGSRYIWRRSVANLHGSCGASSAASSSPSSASSSRCFAAWKSAVAAFLLLAHGSFLTLLFLVSEEPHVFSLLSYTCLGMYVFLVFGLLVLGLAEQVQALSPWAAHPPHPQPRARHLVKLSLALVFTVGCTAVGLLNATQPPLVKRVEIPVHRLPRSFDNLKVVLLSDIHLGPTVGRTRLEMVVRMVNGLSPDLTVIVGDLTDSQVVNLQTATEPLRELKPRVGKYFVTGNHDYYSGDVNNWFKHLRSLGIQPLHNEHVSISSAGDPKDQFCLAGVDDIEAEMLRYPGHGMDLEKALDGCSPTDAIVLLAHQPLAAKRALQTRPDISLILSGHTHAGQIFPLSIGAYLLNPFFVGLYKAGENSFIYVTPGTVFYGIPMRLGSRAEITEIIFKAK